MKTLNEKYTYKPTLYFLLTFFITFLFWFVGAYSSFNEKLNKFYMLFMLAGLITPFILSFIFIFNSGNQTLKKEFVNRLINLKLIKPSMLPVLILIMPLSVVVSILISYLFGGSLSQFSIAEEFSFTTGFVPVLLLLLLAATFEELGWRGYAFDSLQSKYNYFTASLIFAILWSAWHFPLIYVKDSYQYEILNQNILFAINFFLSIVPLGILVSWICIKNGKSILSAILFHFLINFSNEIFNISQPTKVIETFVLIAVVILIVFYDRKLFFSELTPNRKKT
ncbi:MAG: type II CAAX endopeptidase family protein [Ignavibacteriaceae bacterium]